MGLGAQSLKRPQVRVFPQAQPLRRGETKRVAARAFCYFALDLHKFLHKSVEYSWFLHDRILLGHPGAEIVGSPR